MEFKNSIEIRGYWKEKTIITCVCIWIYACFMSTGSLSFLGSLNSLGSVRRLVVTDSTKTEVRLPAHRKHTTADSGKKWKIYL